MVHLDVTRGGQQRTGRGTCGRGQPLSTWCTWSPRQGAYGLFMGMLRQQGKYLKVQF